MDPDFEKARIRSEYLNPKYSKFDLLQTYKLVKISKVTRNSLNTLILFLLWPRKKLFNHIGSGISEGQIRIQFFFLVGRIWLVQMCSPLPGPGGSVFPPPVLVLWLRTAAHWDPDCIPHHQLNKKIFNLFLT